MLHYLGELIGLSPFAIVMWISAILFDTNTSYHHVVKRIFVPTVTELYTMELLPCGPLFQNLREAPVTVEVRSAVDLFSETRLATCVLFNLLFVATRYNLIVSSHFNSGTRLQCRISSPLLQAL